MKPIRWLLAWLLLASAAFAANPKLTVAVDAQGYAQIKAALPTATPYNFTALDLGGERRLLLLTWVDGQRARLAIYNYEFKDFQPGPSPEPIPPDPVPPPVPPDPPVPPVIQKVNFVFLEETADSTVAFAQIRSSVKLRDYAKNGNHSVYFLDRDAKGKDGKIPPTYIPWMKEIDGETLPRLLIQSKENNTILDKMPCSGMTVEQVLAVMKKWGG